METRIDRIEKCLEEFTREFSKGMLELKESQQKTDAQILELKEAQKKTDANLNRTDANLNRTDANLNRTDAQLRQDRRSLISPLLKISASPPILLKNTSRYWNHCTLYSKQPLIPGILPGLF